MADTALSSMTAVVTPAPTTDLLYVVQSGLVDAKATPSQYIGNLVVESTHVVAFRSGANAQTLQLYGTYTNASNYERLAIVPTAGSLVTIVAQTAGTGGDNIGITLQTAGTGQLNFKIATTAYITLGGAADSGVWNIQLNAPNITPGTTNSYDIGSTSLTVRGFYAGTGYYFGSNKVVGARGTAIADAGSGAVAQVASGATETVDKINLILAALRTHGLIAT